VFRQAEVPASRTACGSGSDKESGVWLVSQTGSAARNTKLSISVCEWQASFDVTFPSTALNKSVGSSIQ